MEDSFNKPILMNLNEVAYSISDLFEFEFQGELIERYNTSLKYELICELASYCDLDVKNIILTSGADGALELCFKFFQNKNIHIPRASYLGFESIAEKLGVSWNLFDSIDTSQLMAKLTADDVIFLCRPDNPTGLVQRNLEQSLQTTRAAVVVDEAYIECCLEENLASLLGSKKNIFIVRSFSKSFAIPGLRLGYLLFHQIHLEPLQKLMLDYPVCNLSLYLGLQVLKNKEVIIHRTKELQACCKSLVAEIRDIGFTVSESDTYFFAIQLESRDLAEGLYKFLLDQGIQTGDFTRFRMIRVTALFGSDNSQLVAALTKFKSLNFQGSHVQY